MASYGGGIVCVFIVFCLAVRSLATVYNVGESSGWTVGVDYTNWTSGKTFMVGDSLVFNYGSGHTVDEVSGSDYNTCTVGNSINTDNSGTTTLLLNTAGTHYYICGVIGHCGSGMKLAITVADGGVTAAPSESPPPATTALPPPVTFTSPPGSVLPQPSKSVTLSPFVAVVTAWVTFFKFVLL